MPVTPIRLTGDVERKYIACAIDISETPETPDYFVIGYKITSSAMETNPDIETGTDIRGVNFSTVNRFEPSQQFEPHRMTGGDNGKLAAKLLDMYRRRDMAAFTKFRVLIVWGMLGSVGSYEADLHDECTISIDSIGGESWADMPITVNFGGQITSGVADALIDHVRFTPGT